MTSSDLEPMMLAEARAEVATADHKASMVLAALGVGFGALLAGVIAGNWKPSDLSGPNEFVWWCGAVLAACSVAAAALAVWPRWDSSDFNEGIYYWGHVARFRTFEDFVAALEDNTADSRARTRQQLWQLSNIVKKKYTWVRASFALAALSLIPLVVSVLAE